MPNENRTSSMTIYYPVPRMQDLQLQPILWRHLTMLTGESRHWSEHARRFHPMGGYNQDGHPWGWGRRCGNNWKGHRWTSVLLFLNMDSDISKFNLLECIELHKCVLFCMYPWRRAWQHTPVFLPGESPWTEEFGGLQCIGSQRVRHDQISWAYTHTQYI